MLMLSALFSLAVVVLILAWRAYVFTLLWSWFVTPTFAYPSLSFTQSLGLMVTWMLFKRIDARDRTQKEREDLLIAAFLFPAITLGYGYVVHLLM